MFFLPIETNSTSETKENQVRGKIEALSNSLQHFYDSKK